MAAAGVLVALLLVDATAVDLLVRAHQMHPRAKRVLLVDRDYTSTSPAVREMTLGPRRLSHRPTMERRRVDVSRHERVPLIVEEGARAELREDVPGPAHADLVCV
jgi:hypothetical protein